MVYIFESELPENKSVFFAIIHIFGIGRFNADLVCKKLGLSPNLKVKNLSKEQINKLVNYLNISNLILASELKKFHILQFQQLLSIKSYKGLRKKQGLPIRGQRTHTNARTSRKRK